MKNIMNAIRLASVAENLIVAQDSNLQNSDVDDGRLGDECLEKISLIEV